MTYFTQIKSFLILMLICITFSISAQDTLNQPEETAKVKMYERFKLNIDTITNLATYKSIVDQVDTDADSFYVRAKKWANKKYGLATSKKPILLDKPNDKLVLSVQFNAYTSFNQYNKVDAGIITFNLTFIFKENKYKYIIDNIKHVPLQDEDTIKKLPIEQYEGIQPFEYLLAKKHKVKDSDNLLKCSDVDFQNLIAELKKALKNPAQFNEDEF